MRGTLTEVIMRGEQPWRTNRARALRAQPVSSEDTLWLHLRDRRLNGYKFVRQHPIASYFADFVCRAERIIVEIDGATHGSDEERRSDAERQAALEAAGWRVYRVTNADVRDNLDGVLDGIVAFIEIR